MKKEENNNHKNKFKDSNQPKSFTFLRPAEES